MSNLQQLSDRLDALEKEDSEALKARIAKNDADKKEAEEAKDAK